MKNHSGDLKWEVTELLEKVTVEEAHQAIIRRFNQALDTLDTKGQEVISEYFDGSTLEEIAERHSLSIPEAKALVGRLKQHLLTQLQRNTRARH